MLAYHCTYDGPSLPLPTLFLPPQVPFPYLVTLLFFICSKRAQIKIIDDEKYEKNKNFFIEMMEPRMVNMSSQKGGVLTRMSHC